MSFDGEYKAEIDGEVDRGFDIGIDIKIMGWPLGKLDGFIASGALTMTLLDDLS